MLLDITLEFTNRSAPKLTALMKALELGEQQEFFTSLSDDFEILTREHITKASRTRHKTASRLGAKQSGYLEKLATATEGVRGTGTLGRVAMTLQGDIFKRAFGPVTVKKKDKWLTIPIAAESYSRRAREFSALFMITSKKGNRLLVQRDPDDKKKLKLLYTLKDSVTLPEDRGLLPSDKDYLSAVERAAGRFVKAQLAKIL